MKMNVYYISIEGNTEHFVKKMSQLFKNVALHQISDQSDLVRFKAPFFCFVPTYVRGVQFSQKYKADKSSLQSQPMEEMDTLTMNDELGYANNAKHCLGIVGSGNRNFGDDCYCWTARMYHRKYHIPLIADYEIRGNMEEENVINHRMVKIWNKMTGDDIQFHKHSLVNPRLAKLQKKYHNV